MQNGGAMAAPQMPNALEPPKDGLDGEMWGRTGGGGASHLVRRRSGSQYLTSPCGNIIVRRWSEIRDAGNAPLCGRCIQLSRSPDLITKCAGCSSPLCIDCVEPTEARMLTWLERYHLGGNRYIFAAQVPSTTGTARRRVADAVAVDTLHSEDMQLHGFEVKVSRSNWLDELADPDKWRPVGEYMDRWWLAISDINIIRGGEVPDEWGILLVTATAAHVVRSAPRLDAKPVGRPFLAALIGAALTTRAAMTHAQERP